LIMKTMINDPPKEDYEFLEAADDDEFIVSWNEDDLLRIWVKNA
jgi:hypothetical protein